MPTPNHDSPPLPATSAEFMRAMAKLVNCRACGRQKEAKDAAYTLVRMLRTAGILPDHDPLLAIQEILDGVEWTADTPQRIADVMISAGYRIRDLNDVDLEASPDDAENIRHILAMFVQLHQEGASSFNGINPVTGAFDPDLAPRDYYSLASTLTQRAITALNRAPSP